MPVITREPAAIRFNTNPAELRQLADYLEKRTPDTCLFFDDAGHPVIVFAWDRAKPKTLTDPDITVSPEPRRIRGDCVSCPVHDAGHPHEAGVGVGREALAPQTAELQDAALPKPPKPPPSPETPVVTSVRLGDLGIRVVRIADRYIFKTVKDDFPLASVERGDITFHGLVAHDAMQAIAAHWKNHAGFV